MASWLINWLIVGLTCTVISLTLFYFSIRLRKKVTLIVTLLSLMGSGLSAFAAVTIMLVCFNLQSYQKLTHEEVIGEIAIERIEPQSYLLRLFIKEQAPQYFKLHGDQWQIDARILKWHSWANLLGLHTLYRLERLSSRYHRPQQSEQLSAIALSTTDNAYSHLQWLPFVDSIYGNSAYMPFGHGARYRLSVSTSGIVVRPVNDSALDLVENWP